MNFEFVLAHRPLSTNLQKFSIHTLSRVNSGAGLHSPKNKPKSSGCGQAAGHFVGSRVSSVLCRRRVGTSSAGVAKLVFAWASANERTSTQPIVVECLKKWWLGWAVLAIPTVPRATILGLHFSGSLLEGEIRLDALALVLWLGIVSWGLVWYRPFAKKRGGLTTVGIGLRHEVEITRLWPLARRQ